MKKIYVAIVCIALALFISCDDKKAKDDITKAIEKIGDKAVDVVDKATPTLTKPALSAVRIRKEEPITFPKVARHTYALKVPDNFLTLSDVDKNTGQVRSTEVAIGVVVVATKDGNSIESDPIDFLLYVADKPALVAEITERLAEADGAAANLNYIDTSDITDMSELFKDDTTFDGNIDKWDTSSVEDMSEMFSGASAFNQPLTSWVRKSGRNTKNMFRGATAMRRWQNPPFINQKTQ